jgi:hypothetical protein
MVKAGEVDNPNPGIHSESQARRQIMTISFIIHPEKATLCMLLFV